MCYVESRKDCRLPSSVSQTGSKLGCHTPLFSIYFSENVLCMSKGCQHACSHLLFIWALFYLNKAVAKGILFFVYVTKG